MPGRYRHYKGNEYSVLGTARHSETLEELVVYRQEYGQRGLWARPCGMFAESVSVDGRETPRFCPVAEPGAETSAETGAKSSTDAANLFADIPAQLPAEIVQILLTAADVRIERILSLGQASPTGFWYDEPTHEWVLLVQGAARLQFEGEAPFDLCAGTFVNIPAHRRHRVDWTDPDQTTIWLAVHYGGGL